MRLWLAMPGRHLICPNWLSEDKTFLDLTSSKRLFLIGCDGLIGKALRNRWNSENLICTSRRMHPLNSSAIIWDLVNPILQFAIQPEDVVVLAAAMTSVEACEKNPSLAYRINVEAAEEVAKYCVSLGARLVFLSSSAVFDGTRAKARESDETCPLNEYGRTKAEAEKRIQASGARYLILRLTKVLDPAGGYLAALMQSLAQGKKVTASPDLPVAPLSLHWTVEAIARCLDFRENGIFHFSPKDETNYHELVKKVAETQGFDGSLVEKQSLAELKQRFSRIPRHAALATQKAADQLGLSIPCWEESLR